MRCVLDAVQGVVRGRPRAVTAVTCALFAGGHALLEDIPGSGKTTLARAFARALGGDFARIQATADLLPADITGGAVWEPSDTGGGSFRFVPGPVFANVVLVDELNRTSPRTQSAFLEALDEHAVTVDGARYALPDPFFVVATQNPLEQHGTYALPEAQLDRFMVALRLDPMDLHTEFTVVREQLARATVDEIDPVLSPVELAAARAGVRRVHVADPVLHYAVTIAAATRGDKRVLLGASPRAGIALLRAAQAHACLSGRDYVTPDDVKALATDALAHRLSLQNGPSWMTSRQVVADAISAVPVTI